MLSAFDFPQTNTPKPANAAAAAANPISEGAALDLLSGVSVDAFVVELVEGVDVDEVVVSFVVDEVIPLLLSAGAMVAGVFVIRFKFRA
jgi:hypothetical protein